MSNKFLPEEVQFNSVNEIEKYMGTKMAEDLVENGPLPSEIWNLINESDDVTLRGMTSDYQQGPFIPTEVHLQGRNETAFVIHFMDVCSDVGCIEIDKHEWEELNTVNVEIKVNLMHE